EGPGSIAMRNAAVPVELGPALLPEGGHDLAQLRMYSGAMVALVVVLEHDLPVGGYLVHDAMPGAELGQRIAAQALGHRAQLVEQASGVCRGPDWRQVQEHEAAPGLQPDGPEGEVLAPEIPLLFQKRSGAEVALERVCPRVVRATDSGRETARRRRGRAGLGWCIEHQAAPAMAADVVEGPKLTGPGADHQDALAGE